MFELLSEMDEVSGIAMVGGEADILAEIPYGWEEASRVVLGRIQGIEGVRSTNTLVAVPALPTEDDERDQFSAWS